MTTHFRFFKEARLYLLILSGFVIIVGGKRKTEWITQYPTDYKSMYTAELVYTYPGDESLLGGRVILETTGIYANNNNEVWAIQNSGNMLYSPDGMNFHLLNVPVHHQLTTIKGINNEVWAAGCYGTIIHYKDRKCTQECKGVTDKDIWQLWINPDGKEGWAVGNNGLILHDSLGEWSVVQNGLTENFIHDIWMNTNGKEGWAVGNACTILHYKNRKWTTVITGYEKIDLMKVWMSPDATQGWAIGEHGMLLHYNAGMWERKDMTQNYLNYITMSADGNAGWIVGDEGIAMHYENGDWQIASEDNIHSDPANWWMTTSERVLSDERKMGYLFGSCFDSAGCWLVGDDGIFHTSDNKNFSIFSLPTQTHYYSCIAANNQSIWVCGWDYNIIKITPKPGQYYPTLDGVQYHLYPTTKPNTLTLDLRLTAKNNNLASYLPIDGLLRVRLNKDGDTAHYIKCTFTAGNRIDSSGVWSVKISLSQLGINTDTLGQKLKINFSFLTAKGNEHIGYDIKEGSNNFLTLK